MTTYSCRTRAIHAADQTKINKVCFDIGRSIVSKLREGGCDIGGSIVLKLQGIENEWFALLVFANRKKERQRG